MMDKSNEILLFTCDGAANTGKLAGAVSMALAREKGYHLACLPALALDRDTLVKRVENAEKIIVIDGCPFKCAEKIFNQHSKRSADFTIELSSEYKVKKEPDKLDVPPELVQTITEDLKKRLAEKLEK